MLDTKLKNSKKIKIIVTVAALLVLTFANIFYFPVIGEQAVSEYAENIVEQKNVNTELLESLYMGTHIMYYEQALRTEETLIEPMELFLKEENMNQEQLYGLEENGFAYLYDNWVHEFERYRYEIDYYATNGTVSESNTAQNLELLITENNILNNQMLEEIKSAYRCLWVMEFDELGQLKVRVITTEDISADMLVRSLKQVENERGLANRISDYADFDNPAAVIERVKNFKVVYGISNECEEAMMTVESIDYLLDMQRLIERYAAPIFSLNVLVLALLAFILNNTKIRKDDSTYFIVSEQKKKLFLMEPAILGICLMGSWYRYYCNAIYQFQNRGLRSFSSLIGTSEIWEMLRYVDVITLTFVTFAILYIIFYVFCPVFSLGLKEYISTLERKAMRLKVLIEDLFEVSKASSNNITLSLMSVDIVKLMKQVMVEHKEKYEEAGLQLYWNVPEEKVELQLDSQKTYRIFENLFLNIQKYAMANSRVYIEVTDESEQVRVVIKNMSAEPLNVVGEELTERFVRGDKSRNTEGSGLGLAIVKNFAEIQKGSFEVKVDGDLFKTTLIFKR